MNFKQHDNETLGEAYERFNLLKRKCPNHSLDTMELMQIFTGGMRIQHKMHLDASAGGSINAKTASEVKELIEQMCQNEYNMSNERTSKPVGMLQLDKETAYQKEIDLLKKKLEKVILGAKAKKIQETCDFCHEKHPNRHCIPEGISDEEYAKSTTGPTATKTITFGRGVQPIGQLTKLITNFSKDYDGNTVDNPAKEECKALGEKTGTAEEKRKRDEKELRQLQKWFKQLWLTLEEAYDEFMEELDAYYEETLAERLNIAS
ncbi:hypothetical protein L195_g023376 [Trifolium pratense]|uniref:Retrotransposon gag domain-containing protein n=1 Tax=Trifolium pratense TaxID=57577 RepID=A0A2K3NAP5_TRIPR|nr:hypothetical protein L195_g023376 [Trifolium pratense]